MLLFCFLWLCNHASFGGEKGNIFRMDDVTHTDLSLELLGGMGNTI